MNEKFSLFYDDHCIAEDYTEEELKALCKEFELEFDWDLEGRYYRFYNNHYWCEKELSF